MLTEHEEQCLLFEWADLKGLNLMFAIPNGSNKSIATAMKFKKEGLRKGVPDIFLPYPNKIWSGLFIEMKRKKGGKLSVEQEWWTTELLRKGYSCKVCKGFEEAKEAIEQYMQLGVKG